MQGGEGGAQKAGLVVLAFCLIGIALFAVIDRDRANKLAPAAAVTTTDTTALGDDEPCGGVATVPAAVRASSVGGLSGTSASYDVTDVRVASSDPTWARFAVVAKAGQEGNFQNGYGVAQCTLLGWAVNDVGSSGVGCDGAGAPPKALRPELGLDCPS
jgi:hypothetical protein